MSDNIGLIVIAAIFGGIILGVIGYFVIAFMRGTIRLDLPTTVFNPGDTIKGSFELHTKKPIQGNELVASLIGFLSEKGGTQEVYRKTIRVEEARKYPARYKRFYEFEIAVPHTDDPEFLDSKLGKQLSELTSELWRHKWYRVIFKVEIRLDAK